MGRDRNRASRAKADVARGNDAPKASAAEPGPLPHEILLAIARGEPIADHSPTFSERMSAAIAAAPYYAAKMPAGEHGADAGAAELMVAGARTKLAAKLARLATRLMDKPKGPAEN